MNYQKQNTNTLFWCFILGIILIEYLLFRTYALREIVEYYPADFDQSMYLLQSYKLYETLLNHQLTYPIMVGYFIPASILCSFQSALFFLFFGASRFSALLLNFIYFAALQLFFINTVKKLTHNNGIALLCFALLLLIETPLHGIGGILDARIDFMTFCLYGILVTSVMRSQLFVDKKWSIITAVIAGFLVLIRTLTLTYIVSCGVMMVLYFLIRYMILQHNNEDNTTLKKQLNNILICLIIFILMTLPFLWIDRLSIYDYYWIGHIAGPEKSVRAIEWGITDLVSNVMFYPHAIINHLGKWCVGLCMLIILTALLINRKNTFSFKKQDHSFFQDGLFFLIISIVVPLIILTLDQSKSPIVGGITVIPFLWLIIWISANFKHTIKLNKLTLGIILLLMTGGCFHWIYQLGQHGPAHNRDAEKQVNAMYEKIIAYTQDTANKKNINISHSQSVPLIYIMPDKTTDYIQSNILSVLHYENSGILLKAKMTKLIDTFSTITSAQLLKAFEKTDFFVVTTGTYPDKPIFPYDIAMEKLRPALLNKAKKEFFLLGEYDVNKLHYHVYANPNAFEPPSFKMNHVYFMDNTLPFLKMTGFEQGETLSKWTVQNNASIILYANTKEASQYPTGYINIEVMPLLYKGLTSQRVIATLGKDALMPTPVQAQEWLSLPYKQSDWEDLPASSFKKLVIHFQLPDATAPSQVSNSSDQRPLALRFLQFSATPQAKEIILSQRKI